VLKNKDFIDVLLTKSTGEIKHTKNGENLEKSMVFGIFCVQIKKSGSMYEGNCY